MPEIIKTYVTEIASSIQLGDPVKLGGLYVSHGNIDSKPIIYQFQLPLSAKSESELTFDFGESRQLSSHIGEVDKRLISIIYENSLGFFGRKIRADTIESAYVSNAHDGTWTFQLDPELTIRDQHGNQRSTDDLDTSAPLTVFAELIGVSIGKTTIKPTWKLHKILVYKRTTLPELTPPSDGQETVAQSDEDLSQLSDEATGFYPDANEP